MSHAPTSSLVRLTREVRFAINERTSGDVLAGGCNGYGAVPAIRGMGRYLSLRVELEGQLDPATGYVLNIRDIDLAVRERVIPYIERHSCTGHGNAALLPALFDALRSAWPAGVSLRSLEISLSPFTCIAALARELPMVRFSQKFEFSASHRLHSPALSDAENRDLFGKCNNPHGHGHNYEVQVTLLTNPAAHTDLVDMPTFERIVNDVAIAPLDHRYLNVEIPEFRELIPTVENIAREIYRRLKPALQQAQLKLASVTVWETSKTWAQYEEA